LFGESINLIDLLVGVIIATAIILPTTYVVVKRRSKRKLSNKYVASDQSFNEAIGKVGKSGPRQISKLIQDFELEKARRDLKTLVLEKELLSNAITRVYEAESAGKISKDERERLSSKYRDQLKNVETQLGDRGLVIEVGELENLRRELVNLLERKLDQIESRLKEIKPQLEHVKTIDVESAGVKEPKTKTIEKKVEPKTRAPEFEAEEKVKAIRKEVLDALARLEQMDLEG